MLVDGETLSSGLPFFFILNFRSFHWGGAVVSTADQSQNQVAHHPLEESEGRECS